MVAQVFPVYAAIWTDTAGVAEPRDADALAHCQPFYAGSDRIDPADDLVTGDDRHLRVWKFAIDDIFALYLKTKNFHWHMSGRHFRDYHLLLDEQGDQIFAITDPIAERVRKIGGTTLRSIGHILRQQRIVDNDAEYVEPQDMLAELRDDNQRLVSLMREVHNVCDAYGDVATTSLLEVWIDEAERRTWFLFESTRNVSSAND
jgi:starvation-inducible DNA-binding protein